MTVHSIGVSNDDEFLTRQELAAELKISLPTLDKLRRQGMPEERWGLKAVRFRRRRVLRWLDEFDGSV